MSRATELVAVGGGAASGLGAVPTDSDRSTILRRLLMGGGVGAAGGVVASRCRSDALRCSSTLSWCCSRLICACWSSTTISRDSTRSSCRSHASRQLRVSSRCSTSRPIASRTLIIARCSLACTAAISWRSRLFSLERHSLSNSRRFRVLAASDWLSLRSCRISRRSRSFSAFSVLSVTARQGVLLSDPHPSCSSSCCSFRRSVSQYARSLFSASRSRLASW
mmetsp:Transcript_47669/g.119223  ORF Transcript_47669/g.119223 Transcript_47669/m.119223 type:complete len:222 (+) Transcript_47669:614-1279(+)